MHFQEKLNIKTNKVFLKKYLFCLNKKNYYVSQSKVKKKEGKFFVKNFCEINFAKNFLVKIGKKFCKYKLSNKGIAVKLY